MVRMPASIGPRQGLQPNAKASPRTSAPNAPRGFWTSWNRLSWYKRLILKMPIRCRPKMMMISPATRYNHDMLESKVCPIHVAEAPRVMKVIEKPTMNIIEFRTTELLNADFSGALSWSRDTPDMIEI